MFFDYTDGDFCYGSGDVMFDSEGNNMTRLSDSTAIDWETGDIHFGNFIMDDDDDDDWINKKNTLSFAAYNSF